MDDTYFESVVIKGMGKATSRAVNLAIQLNKNNHDTFSFKIRTYTVEILHDKPKIPLLGTNKDSFNPDEVDLTKQHFRRIPALEITVNKHPLELSNMRRIRNIEADAKKR